MRSLSSSVAILVGTLILCVVPAQSQIVSYRDDSGKRVFVNSNPVYTPRPTAKPVLPKGFKPTGIALSTTQAPSAPSLEMSTLELANREKIEQMIREVSDRYHVDPALVRAVIQTESNWNSSAISRKGARGLMQLVPGTAQQLGVNNAFDPQQNLDKALAAYNAGPGAVDRAGGIPRYRETREYVQKVTDSYFRPGSDRLPRAFDQRRPIYRAVEADGRVVFTNE
jgi:hypothetical protein